MGVVIPLEEGKNKQASVKPLVDLTKADMERVNQLILSKAGSDVQMIPEVANHLISSGGKRLRPMLTLASSCLFGYKGENHIKLATSVDVAPYAASKTTILSITRSFAYALAGRPVRVNAICPGIVDTPMQDTVLAGMAKLRGMDVAEMTAARNRTVPLGRAARPEECAGAIWFLLSDEAGYMTGQAVNFTGGLVTW